MTIIIVVGHNCLSTYSLTIVMTGAKRTSQEGRCSHISTTCSNCLNVVCNSDALIWKHSCYQCVIYATDLWGRPSSLLNLVKSIKLEEGNMIWQVWYMYLGKLSVSTDAILCKERHFFTLREKGGDSLAMCTDRHETTMAAMVTMVTMVVATHEAR